MIIKIGSDNWCDLFGYHFCHLFLFDESSTKTRSSFLRTRPLKEIHFTPILLLHLLRCHQGNIFSSNLYSVIEDIYAILKR